MPARMSAFKPANHVLAFVHAARSQMQSAVQMLSLQCSHVMPSVPVLNASSLNGQVQAALGRVWHHAVGVRAMSARRRWR